MFNGTIPSRVALLVKDFVSYRNRMHVKLDDINNSLMNKRSYLKIFFHNKDIDMINLPTILHSKTVTASIPKYLDGTPPIVSYTYPRTIASRIFNFKEVIKELNFNAGISEVRCNCSLSPYIYKPVGHVVTGNLNIVSNRHVRRLLMKGPKYREQNDINWSKNEELCFKAINEYRVNWARRENVDIRVLADWEHEVRTRIKQRILYLRKKHRMIRKRQVLKDNKHSKYIKDFHEQYVLVPADKATNNIIVICKKYYLGIILSELSIVNPCTYINVTKDCNC